jgi:hypothetical protein
MRIGFTGSRDGMTDAQRSQLEWMLAVQSVAGGVEFHHGDCIGSDAEAHDIARQLGYKIVIHPPVNDELRAFCKGDVVLEPKEYHARDRDIVDDTDMTFATPRYHSRGTKYTIGYADEVNKPCLVIDMTGQAEWSVSRGEPGDVEAG